MALGTQYERHLETWRRPEETLRSESSWEIHATQVYTVERSIWGTPAVYLRPG